LLRGPTDVVVDETSAGDPKLYVTDKEHDRIRVVSLATGLCPQPEVSRLECGNPSISPTECASLGCCFDSTHEDCLTQLNPDGRSSPPFEPLEVKTKLEQSEANPPISFVSGRSFRCCYPQLRDTQSLEVLESPQAMAFDSANGHLYVTQPRRHRVVRLTLSQGRCAAGSMLC
jgi:hypothetical protein